MTSLLWNVTSPRLGASVIELIIVEKEMRDFAGGAGEKRGKLIIWGSVQVFCGMFGMRFLLDCIGKYPRR